jgi:molecular chaperone GrpE
MSGTDQERPSLRVEDRRHWARADEHEANAEGTEGTAPLPDPEKEALLARAESAEAKLREYQSAFLQFRAEQEQVRERLGRDVERRVQLGFGSLVADLVETLDDLERALEHATGIVEAEPLARGVALARARFLAALQKSGVERIDPTGAEFDPTVAEAVGVAPVDDAALEGTVVHTDRPGYRLGDRIIRPARVTVGRRLA